MKLKFRMPWFRKKKEFGVKPQKKKELPDGLWLKCEKCAEILYRMKLERNLWICSKCNFHFRISSRKYAEILLDDGKIEEIDGNLTSKDPLDFPKYKEKLKKSQETTGLTDGVITGRAKVDGLDVIIAMTDFDFMGGSMGSVVGERVARAIRLAIHERFPLIILTASGGGARMQEGIFSLMQLAKTSAALAELSMAKVPYITVLTHPTMAGVMASFASLGDVIIAEPGALLGFTGPRVIQQTIGEKLPGGFQRSEFLLEHGMIDMIVGRKDLKSVLSRLLNFFENEKPVLETEK